MQLAPGAITDIAGIRVGHAAVAGRPSGCTVVLCERGLVCGVAVRGGAPGTRETDLLRPDNTVERVHAVLLTGGSAFGLDAAAGVMRWLDDHDHGLAVGPARPDGRGPVRVPIVPSAVLFDLWLGDPALRPDAATGHAACVAARAEAPAQGNHGAGLGATVGKLWGIGRAMKGGIGTASVRAHGLTVAALVAVNAIGDVVDADGTVIAGARSADGTRLARSTAALLADPLPPRLAAAAAGSATTIGVVATDATLTKAQASQLAGLAHHGLSRSVDPITPHDGDTLFVLAAGRAAAPLGDLTLAGVLAAEAVARAVRNGVRAAQALADPVLPAASDQAGR